VGAALADISESASTTAETTGTILFIAVLQAFLQLVLQRASLLSGLLGKDMNRTIVRRQSQCSEGGTLQQEPTRNAPMKWLRAKKITIVAKPDLNIWINSVSGRQQWSMINGR
jgi:hypothetical protein